MAVYIATDSGNFRLYGGEKLFWHWNWIIPIWVGGHYVSTRTHIQETTLHNNCKELLAAWLGLQCYASHLQDAHMHLWMDNAVAVAYVNRMGCLHFKDLCELTSTTSQGICPFPASGNLSFGMCDEEGSFHDLSTSYFNIRILLHVIRSESH